MSFAHSRSVDRIERAANARAGEQFRRGETGALLSGPSRDFSVTRDERVAGVDHHFVLEQLRQILANLRERAVRYRDQQHFAKGGGFARGTGTCIGPELSGERLVVLDMAR